ncbi:Part of AAA domain-containing protein [Poseidonocella pacifica]|uniref:Part of AAA domain-containing protein n=1 Tax=Poseidonocella pacifica TaxID=871651 RepID=A0A1I0YNH3_9RHOB|nr:AAA domain-containing protein [Poseidonocella pacifica]SFB14949.1 Part of AAA domain-containing protein [Poseidonocella pacifica]
MEDHFAPPEMTLEDRQKLAGLLGFAEGVLRAREKVQMEMQAGLGVFHENDFHEAPGVHLDCDDGAWMRIERQRETAPPDAVEHVAAFFVSKPKDPMKAPQMRSAISVEVNIEEASDLCEGGLLDPDDVRPIIENGVTTESRVKVILHAENLPEMRRDFVKYVGGPWAEWAKHEKPVRRTIDLYNNLFSIHSAIHTSEGAPPELVWGIGVGRWKHRGAKIDMPVIEQLVDIDLEPGGVIAIRPRDLAPGLSLKPYIEIEVDNSHKLQHTLQGQLSVFLDGNLDFTPFSGALWEPLLDTVASEIASDGEHVTREMMEEGKALPPAEEQFRVTSSWAIFGRPRSNEARLNDLGALRKQIDDDTAEVPASLRGYAVTPPDAPKRATSAFGLDMAVLRGETDGAGSTYATAEPRPTAEAAGAARAGAGQATAADGGNAHPVHFFPLPFNHEQGRISDLLDDPKVAVACVSGPPGTGKSHSIANIISHQMALGKRVLVTARTPEAIAAVREKLPESLRPLAIASVGTDRDSAQQLQDAVKELSHEVVTLDTAAAVARKGKLEQQIIDCDETAGKADKALARIAQANLDRLEWKGDTPTPMDLVGLLEEEALAHGWFTDAPDRQPPAQLDAVLVRLKSNLPELAADIVYAGATLPDPSELPGTADLIAAHKAELAWNNREIVDYSTAPRMARDNAGADEQAARVLAEAEALSRDIDQQSEAVRALTRRALSKKDGIDRTDLKSLLGFLSGFKDLDAIIVVRYGLGNCKEDEFVAAVNRGAAGQKPVGFGIFNGALKSAIGSVRVKDAAPASVADWRSVLDAYHLRRNRERILLAVRPLIGEKLVPVLPDRPHEIAQYLKDRQAELGTALATAERLSHVCTALEALFPFGLDLDGLRNSLNCTDILFALRGNLPDGYAAHPALDQLRTLSEGATLPVIVELGNLAGALGREETNPNDIIDARAAITTELGRLAEVSRRLQELGADLDALSEAGAPEWRARLEDRPDAAPDLIPDTWKEAWAWAEMRARVNRIIDLGNGDDHRKAKADAMKRRRRLFEELIRTRTLLGLKERMTPSIRQAMEAFTQAVAKIGTGKGKKAPRFIRAARDAAKRASAAAPVWIMPEYKIPEQLPADFGDFDLVILDEASQSDITALAALARGKKILVVGDEEQVSPSVVGISMQKINGLRAEFLEGLPGKDLIDENSSIFEITKRMHPDSHVMLREHFRCVAPIIQFSTRYYNNELVPLRVPKASERFDPPLADVYIPGAARQGKTNASEARWIVDEIARLIQDPGHDGRDIGVISLIGSEQAEKIGRMLVEDDRIGPEKIEERHIIYGDARTMQGQERSIVFLSMVATPGHAYSQTKREDQQRINVAMSRARDRLYLVRSVQLEDLRPNDIKAQILQHFANPMPDGRVVTGGEIDTLLDRCDSGFEREVLQMLLDANYRVRPQVAAGGFSIDLVVEGADDRRLAIELDGDQFHGPEVWEHDMIRQAALERAGWVFWRVFGSQWKANRDYWWANLCETLDRLKIEPIGVTAIDDRFTEVILIDAFAQAGAVTGEAPTAGEPANEAQASASEGDSMTILSQAPADTTRKPTPSSTASEPEDVNSGGSDRPSAHGTSVTPDREGSTGPDAPRDLFGVPQMARPERKPVRSAPPQPELALGGAATTNDAMPPQEPAMRSQADDRRAVVTIGSTVRLEKRGNRGGKMEITLVEDGHDVDLGMIGVHTPLGQALLDAEVGDYIEYRAGAYLHEVRVLQVN